MTQEQLDRRVITFIIGAFTLCFLVFFSIGNQKECPGEIQINTDTIIQIEYKIDTIIKTQIKKQKIYEKEIDTIYLLNPLELSREYSKSISILDSLNRKGFFQEY